MKKMCTVLNWLGRQATQAIKSQGITTKTPKEFYDALEKIFRPKSNDTIAKFRFCSMKQKQGQSVDAYLTDLRLMISKCPYHRDTLDDLLKDQFLFGITVKEIKNSLLIKIASYDSIGKCLCETRKVKAQIKQRKLPGIKTNVNYDAVGTCSGNKIIDPNPRTKAMVRAVDVGMVTHQVEMVVIASFAEANIHLENALLMSSSATNVMVKTILAKCADLRPDHRVVAMTKVRINVSLDLKQV